MFCPRCDSSKLIRIFLDCGGHDGCSVLKFLTDRPDFSCITFEPNPQFKRHYWLLPTTLNQSAVSTYDGTATLWVDSIDGDGSTLVTEKRVDATGAITNDQCPVMAVTCVDLSRFILANFRDTDYVVLKLDVEGAEYSILPHLISTGAIDRLSELFVEFHWERCGVDVEFHRRLVEELEVHLDCKEWDARDFSLQPNIKSKLRRSIALALVWGRRAISILRNSQESAVERPR